MGSGTTLVEALANGRHAIGSDPNRLAHFLARTKTTILTAHDLGQLQVWMEALLDKQRQSRSHLGKNASSPSGEGMRLPWPIRKNTELILDEIALLQRSSQRRFARCALLGATQWAVDCTVKIPSASDFRKQFVQMFHANMLGALHFREQTSEQTVKPRAVCLDVLAEGLKPDLWKGLHSKPKLVVTSPPYPGVHVLYHRWQIHGRKETPAPYWIIGEPDGHGESYYTMGGRSKSGIESYFRHLETSFVRIQDLLAPEAMVVQLVSFSDVKSQLPRYLGVMARSGLEQVEIHGASPRSGKGMWRDVPSRRWYASYRGNLSSARELLLIHKKPK
jgi:hypothetical protein